MRFFCDGPTFVRNIDIPQLALAVLRVVLNDADFLFGVLDDADVLFGVLNDADILFGVLDDAHILVMQARYVSGRPGQPIRSDDQSCHLLTVIFSSFG